VNAPVFIFTKHISGWWTGECKGKYLSFILLLYSHVLLTRLRYGLFPSNFVTEEFHVTLRPKAATSEADALEHDRGVIPVIAGGAESTNSEGSDDDTDSDEEEDEDEEEDGEAEEG
jgi:hypothetical protein